MSNAPATPNGSLKLRCVKEFLHERFVVPSYQRGYRWTELEVRALLDDLREFERSDPTRESFYCLQPVVVRRGEDGRCEVIDGQQRLTTIRLLLSYLKREGLYKRTTPYSIEYASRAASAAALDDPSAIDPDDNIDFHYIHQAWGAIKQWFDDSGSDTIEQKIGGVLLNPPEDGKNAKIIWYELDEREQPIDVFVRLNIGKIPLTNSELIRALLLNKKNFKPRAVAVGTGELPPRAEDFRPYEIAQQWDEIERQLQDDRYWHFLQGVNKPPPSRIELIFELLVLLNRDKGIEIPNQRYGIFFAYSTLASANRDSSGAYQAGKLWWSIKRVAMRLREWFDDRRMYHLVGCLVNLRSANAAAQRKVDPRRAALEVLVDALQRSENQSRSEVRAALREQIREQLFGEAVPADADANSLKAAIGTRLDHEDFEYDEGSAAKERIRSVLLTFNVATHLRNTKSNLFFPFDAFQKEAWDIEHIRATMDQMPRRVDDQKRWLQSVMSYLGALGEQAPEVTSGRLSDFNHKAQALLDARVFDPTTFAALYEQALAAFGATDPGRADGAETGPEQSAELIDGGDALWNLALLDSGTNRGIRNALFPIKRQMVLRREREGLFVPVCTRNVFLKYYTQELGQVKNMLYWNEADRRAYREAMVNTLTSFFLED